MAQKKSSMFHTMDGRSLKPGLTVVCLLLTHCCAGQSQVAGRHQPVVAVVGDDVILPCHLEPPVDAVAMTLEWARADLHPRFVHLRRLGKDSLSHQHPSYAGRTSMSTDDLKQGDVSLKLSRVKVSDEGHYKCFIPSVEKESTVQLLVGSPLSPVIKMRESQSGVTLECESAGWYIEPELLWLDAEGNIISAGPTETLRGPDGLYTVSSSVTVEHKHNNTFTCKLQQNKTNQTRETKIQVPEDVFVVQSSSRLHITIGVVVIILCLIAAFFVVWKLRQNKTSESKTGNPEEEEGKNQSGEESKKLLKNTEANVAVKREGTALKLQMDEEKGEGNGKSCLGNKLTSHESALPCSDEGGGHQEEEDDNKWKETAPQVPVEGLHKKTQDARQNDPNEGGENDKANKSISNKECTADTEHKDPRKTSETEEEQNNLSGGLQQKEGDQKLLGDAGSRQERREDEPGKDGEEVEGETEEKESKIQADEETGDKTDAEIQKEAENKNEGVVNNQGRRTSESDPQQQEVKTDVPTKEDEEEKPDEQKRRTSASLSSPSSKSVRDMETEETHDKTGAAERENKEKQQEEQVQEEKLKREEEEEEEEDSSRDSYL